MRRKSIQDAAYDILMDPTVSDVRREEMLRVNAERNDTDPATFKPLPQVSVDGKWYFVDERLAQIRNVDDPTDFVPFLDADDMWEFINDGEPDW